MDAAGFETFFQRHYQFCYLMALRFTRDRSDAQDVAQAVFCKIWAAQPTLQCSGIQRWLARVTKNVAIDLMRKRLRERHYVESCSVALAQSAEDEAMSNIEGAAVLGTLRTLRAETRDLLEESFLEELSHSTIAQRRRMALGTVKSRIRSGLTHLRSMLEPNEHFPASGAILAPCDYA